MTFRWHHCSLAVADLAVSVAFYDAMFGFEVQFQANLDTQIAAITDELGLSCELAQLRQPDSEMTLELIAFSNTSAETINKPTCSGSAHISFVVDNLDEALSKLTDLGGYVLGEIVVFEEGKSVYCREPGGSFIELEELFEHHPFQT
ncbi:MAG: VOC family protein [Deinococcota bacterium]